MHLLFLDSAGPWQLELDYAGPSEESAVFLAAVRRASAEVVPDTRWVVAGQSMGGLFAALSATRHPDLVRAAVAQSPSLWWPTPASPWEHADGWFEERSAADGGAPILLEAGSIDALVSVRCRHTAALLRAQGTLIDYREHPAGHDVLQWQATLPDALADVLAAIG